MENVNYDLLKLLHNALDDHWRLKKHYIEDAAGACKRCQALFKKLMMGHEETVKMLQEEMARHFAAKSFK